MALYLTGNQLTYLNYMLVIRTVGIGRFHEKLDIHDEIKNLQISFEGGFSAAPTHRFLEFVNDLFKKVR